MELQEFVKNFADQFDETDPSEISAETKFRELDEWSSLIGLSVIAMIDDEYDVTLRGDDMRKAQTVGQLFEIVKGKL